MGTSVTSGLVTSQDLPDLENVLSLEDDLADHPPRRKPQSHVFRARPSNSDTNRAISWASDLVDVEGRSSLSPFEELDSNVDPDRTLSELIERFELSHDFPYAQRLGQRLRYLRNIAVEETPADPPMNPGSLRNFISFLES